ncbi:carboxylating nicotinate-nucleotide diphosphorylase [Alkalihalobacterium chitinilyticum]|uniref:nicotinate-nucleotide diphosphorylase (carboxylating) n=1 Tax=Alkalihalobacterium chitinilyticum TaxID=2980103 RepID=A0ABT5VHT5_9BACI|nr:carboxylating nicotinate-nucleotide diphosphorylase [Alkalihalobacterium chitinilyticum]MDE5415011.1 carboxylating nicotinate-nucleotide diphosphorylase [Alkalihalobacterium chitinilyticum]
MNHLKVKEKLQQFFIEDIGEGDVSTSTIFSDDDIQTGKFIIKGEGVISGLQIIKLGYELLNPNVDVQLHYNDGDNVTFGTCVAQVTGPVKTLLTGERVILNLLQRMSGIATFTRTAVDTLNDNHTRICDTRKTTPGLRMFEKYAVRSGGGFNHRFGLYDGVMIKDNHITAAGSIMSAVNQAKSTLGHMVNIEVEVETEEEVREAIEAGAHIIMFDNCPPEVMREWVKLVPKHIVTEASGGIQVSNLGNYRNIGVDYISLGALTHSVKALDISFNLEGGKKG